MAKTRVTVAESICYDFLCSIIRLHNNRQLTPEQNPDPDIQAWAHRYWQQMPEWVVAAAESFFNLQTSFGLTLCGLVESSGTNAVIDFLSYLQTVPASQLVARFLTTGGGVGADVSAQMVEDMQHQQAAALRFVQEAISFGPEEKWRVLEYLLQPERTKDQLLRLLSWHYEHIYCHHEAQVSDFLRQASKDLRDRLRYDDEYLRLLLPYDRGRPPKALTIALSYYYEASQYYDVLDAVYLFGFRYQEDIERRHSVFAGAQVFKALADETRLRILKLLLQRPRYGHELAQKLSISNSTISHHVAILAISGMVIAYKQDNRVYYRIDKSGIYTVVHEALERLLAE
jgi:DNA-binding transcriptional ArsR family regulator